ncbi:DUF4112 domain-containing protein [Singulisphaera rosea]
MRPTKTTLEPPASRAETAGLEQLAWLMDRAFQIPGTRIRVGLDAILGLFPGAGDIMTGVVQIGIVLVALYRFRVPKPIAARMAANVLLDTALGALPILGDLFDVAFKANTRNLQLLNQVQEARRLETQADTRPSILFLTSIAAALILALVLVIVGFVTVVRWLFERTSG